MYDSESDRPRPDKIFQIRFKIFFTGYIGQELPGPGSIYVTQNATFRAPVFVGDKVTVSVTVKEIRPNGVVTLEHQAHVNDRLVLEGKSVILFEPVVDG